VNVKKLVLAAIAVGIAVNVFDFVVHGLLLGSTYASLPEVFRQENNVGWLVALDFLMALVFVWVYVRVRASFAPGATGGAAFGLYAGVLLGFPMQLFAVLMYEGFPYWLSWAWVVHAIAWGVLAGAVAGAVYGRGAASA
jgi:hypothetical protein